MTVQERVRMRRLHGLFDDCDREHDPKHGPAVHPWRCVEFSAETFDTLTDPKQPVAIAPVRAPVYPDAVVGDLKHNGILVPGQRDRRRTGVRMSRDVCQSFLRDTKQRDGDGIRQVAEFRIDRNDTCDTVSLHPQFDQPFDRGGEPKTVKNFRP